MTTTTKFLGITMGWTSAAMVNAEEIGLRQAEVERDIESVRQGRLTRDALLSICLDGADEDRRVGWGEYADAIQAAANA